MAFDVQAALDEGYSQEEIDAFLAQENQQPTEEITTEEIVVTPEPPQAQPQPTTGFDVQGALDEGYSQEEVNTFLAQENQQPKPPQPTTGFDVQGALDEGYSQEEVNTFLAQENQQPTQPIPTDVEDTTFFGRVKQSFKEGIESFGDIGSGWDLAVQDVTGDKKEAAQRMASIKGEAAADNLSRLPTITAQDIQDEFQKSGLIPAGMMR